MSPSVEKLIRLAQSLSPDERQELSSHLHELASQAASPTLEEQLDQAMLRAGLIAALPPRDLDPVEYHAWQPVAVGGKPLSESIVEERR
jgi:hypothetical protein